MKNKVQMEDSIAEIFDAEFGDYDSNIQFYLDFMEGTRVLDLSCGTGRTVIPLSQQGFECVGLDSSRTLLQYASKKAGSLPVSFVLGDMRQFELHRKFDLILLSGHAFQSFATPHEQQRMLTCVQRHLRERGLFIFQVQNLTSALMQDESTYSFWHTFKDTKGQRIKVFGKRRYNFDDSTVTYKIKRSWQEGESFSEMRLLLTSLDALKDLLQAYGFDVIHIFSDYQKAPYFSDAENSVMIAQFIGSNDKG
ncbi:MAG: class I SAM-dependent DNA methyltransferase [Candidatus Nucleicultricaceae bacterium]